MDNYTIADQFSLLSKLMDIHGENSFRTKTYSIAAFNIEKLDVQLAEIPRDRLFAIKGIGESIGKKVIEIIDNGEMKSLREYIEKTPPGILEMMSIKGLGPKKINTIWKELEIESIGELLYACNENRLSILKGFGEKTQNSIAASIEFFMRNQGSYLYAQIESAARAIDQKIRDHFPDYQTELTGAFRRQLETIDVLEWCTTAPASDLKKFFEEIKIELVQESPDHLLFKAADNMELKFHLSDAKSFAENLFATSCSVEFLDASEKQGVFKRNGAFKSEEDIFEKSGLLFIPPPLRESESMLTRAKQKKLPVLIQPEDIRSIIHSHSNWSDGVHTIEQMALALIKKKYEFLVISDHSKSAFYAKGLDETRIREQHKYVDELNEKLKPFRIFKSIECDILNDGNLDYTDDILSSFDLVITSVHSNLKMTEEKAMLRLMKAIANPYTIILGHMTGRLLLSRNGYPVDHKKIIEACAEHNVAIEINAHPRRLDIDWRWVDYALEKGVMLSINPDAHDVEEFDNVKYGVLVAQKGGLTKENNLSSFSLSQFEDYLSGIRKLKGIG